MFVNRLNHQNKLVNPKKKISPGLLLYTFICLLLLVSLYKNTQQLFSSKSQLIEANKKLVQESDLLTKNKERLSMLGTNTYVDQVARNTLGLSKPNELTLVFPNEEDLKKLSPRLFEKKQDIKEETSYYKKWLQLLF